MDLLTHCRVKSINNEFYPESERVGELNVKIRCTYTPFSVHTFLKIYDNIDQVAFEEH